MHFAVAMAGAVINAINTRLNAKNIVVILNHSEAKVFFLDYQFVQVAQEALRAMVEVDEPSDMPLVVVIDDVDAPSSARLGELEYEELVRKGSPEFVPVEVDDDWDFGRRSFEAPMAAERER